MLQIKSQSTIRRFGQGLVGRGKRAKWDCKTKKPDVKVLKETIQDSFQKLVVGDFGLPLEKLFANKVPNSDILRYHTPLCETSPSGIIKDTED